MMKCIKCNNKSVYLGPNYCKEHFIEYVEQKFEKTIKDYKLLNKKDKIIVATSGGKDSTTVLYLTHKKFPKTQALAIDEGIRGYRPNTLEDLKKFCNTNKIKLKVTSIKEEFGYSLDELVKKTNLKPCTVCGVIRRYLLNKYSKGFDKIVTGHNLDDECQSIMMNILKGTMELNSRLGPSTGIKKYKSFIQRVKPLYILREKEILAYTILKGFEIRFIECPYANLSFRGFVRDQLNDYETQFPGTKENILNNFLAILPKLKKHYSTTDGPVECKYCGEPSKSEICKTCKLLDELKVKCIKI